MNLDDDAKEAVRNLGDAINSAVGESRSVVDAIERLRSIGYEPHLTLRLEIALERIDGRASESEDLELDLTDEDLRTLQRMKIKF